MLRWEAVPGFGAGLVDRQPLSGLSMSTVHGAWRRGEQPTPANAKAQRVRDLALSPRAIGEVVSPGDKVARAVEVSGGPS